MSDDGINFGDIFKAVVVLAAAEALQAGVNSLTAGKIKGTSQAFPAQVSASAAYIMVGGYSKTTGLEVFKGCATNGYCVIQAVHDGRLSDYLTYYLNENTVTLAGDNRVNHVYLGGVEVTDGRYLDDPGQRVNIQHRLGLATETAYADMVTRFPGIWTTDHRGDGVGSVCMSCFAAEAKFQSGIFPVGIPTLAVVARPGDIYDWRDEEQDRSDPTTWGPCHNPVVNRVHSEWFRWGRDWDRCIAPVLSDLTAEANICDEAVTLHAGGSEPRYTVAGWYIDDEPRADVRKKFEASMDGFVTIDALGRLIVKCGHYEEPTFTLTADYIEDYTWTEGQVVENHVSRLDVTFTNPGSDYNEVPCDPWVIDGDSTRAAPLSLPWVTSFSQARRLAKRAAARANPAYSGYVKTGLHGLNALGQRYIRVQNPGEDGMEDVVCEVTDFSFDAVAGQVTITIISADTNIDDWNPSTEEGAPVSTIARPIAAGLAVPTIDDATAFYDEIADGSTGVRISIDASGPSRSDLTWFYRWKIASSSTWTEVGPVGSGDTITIDTGFVPANASIDLQVDYRTGGGSPSDWSTTTTVSTSTSAVAPSDPSWISATGGTGQAVLDWRNSASANFDHIVLSRGTTTSFGAASAVGSPFAGAPGATEAYTNTGLAAGTYYYWITAFNASGAASNDVGPQSATVT